MPQYVHILRALRTGLRRPTRYRSTSALPGRSLGDAVIKCYRRAPELAGLATIALSGIGAKPPRTLMQHLKRDYQATCAEHPCVPFEELSRTASKPGNPP